MPTCERAIGENLARAGLADRTQVIIADAAATLRQRIAPEVRFDLVFFDPPFAMTADGIEPDEPVVSLAAERLAQAGVLMLRQESTHRMPPRFGPLGNIDERRWGRNAVGFYAWPDRGSEAAEPPA